MTHLIFLSKISERAKNHDRDRQKEQQQSELVVWSFERVSETLQASAVSRQFQNSQNSHDSEHLHDATYVVEFEHFFIVSRHQNGDIIWKDR